MKKKEKVKLKFNKKLCLIILSIITIIVITIIIVIANRKTDINHVGWMDGLEQVDYMNIKGFTNNTCNKEYYSPVFKINENTLYDFHNKQIKEGVFSILILRYGDCNDELVFVTGLNGKLYYINNQKNNKYKQYQQVEIPSVLYTTEIGFDDENRIITTSYNGTQDDITEYVNNILN